MPNNKGKTELTINFTVPPDLVAEGDRIFASHSKWMQSTHPREGAKALLEYSVAKGPELSSPTDPSSKPTGNTTFVLTEVYESAAGAEEHWKMAQSWQDFRAFQELLSKTHASTLYGSPIMYSL